MNIALLQGVIRRPPTTRDLASGRRVVSYDVAVPSEAGPVETVPVSWFDPPPSATRLGEGHEVVVVGRVRRHFYRADGRTRSRTDVVADTVVRRTARARSRRVLEAAVDAVTAATAGPGH